VRPAVTGESAATRGGGRHLLHLIRPWRWLLTLIVGLFIVAAALEVVPSLVVRQIVDDHVLIGESSGLLGLALLYLGAVATVQALSALATYLTAFVAERTLQALRVRLFAHVQALPISFFDQTSLGDVMSRCTADVEAVDTLFSSGVAKAVADLFRLVTVAVAMALLSPPLALISALVGPPILVITRLLQVRVRTAERRNRRAVGALNAHLQESLGGVEVIRAFAAEPQFVHRFRIAVRDTLLAYNNATIYAALYMPLMATLAALATALLLWAGTREAFIAWGISIGTLTAFMLLFQQFFTPITSLGDEWQTVQSALSGAERIFQILGLPTDEPPGVERGIGHGQSQHGESSQNGTAGSGTARSGIELSRVIFGYVPGRPVLQAVTLAVRPGEHVALVGRTGAGKSSILHLLGGLYAPWSGAVRVGGLDPRALAGAERRQVIGVVPQAVQLFSGTVFDNLTLYDPSVGRETVERAARDAGAEGLIRSLPAGYDTVLSGAGRGHGAQLSAGQRQLLSLTRALVWNPVVLLLDEATAAIDGTSDAAVRSGLRTRATREGTAVLTVAHRLSTAREADRVIVLEAGHVVEAGSPDQLLHQGGRFAALVELEAAGWDWQAGITNAPDVPTPAEPG
jgi:ABC-type multidrug transport system fused ATPase/permease subunit